jgi:hypothetical protein
MVYSSGDRIQTPRSYPGWYSPWSLIRILRHLNLLINCLNKKCTPFSMLQSLTSVETSHLVKYFVIVMMYISSDLLSGGLIGPKKYISHL